MSGRDELTVTASPSEPEYRPSVYLISTRPVSHMNHFSAETLLFQPDTRLFCHHGSDCEVRNRYHRSRYNHVLPAVDSAPAKTAHNPLGVPGVLRTWALEDNVFSNANIGVDTLPRGSRIILYVHGHRTRYYKATATLRHIDDLCAASNSSAPPHVIGFLWPCHSKKVSYVKARPKASGEASERLAQCIRALQSRGNEIHIVAHSLGCRLALSCLLSNNPTEKRFQIVKSLVMLAAAVSEFDFHKEFPRHMLNVQTIYNVFSTNDPVLGKGFELAEKASGMYVSLRNFAASVIPNFSSQNYGKYGAADVPRDLRYSAIGSTGVASTVEAFRDVNGSCEIPTHSIHAYLAAPSVQQLLRRSIFEWV